MHLAAQVDELRAGGSRVETIFPDGDSLNAFGVNMMDLSTVRPPLEPVTTKAGALPRSSPNCGADAGRGSTDRARVAEGLGVSWNTEFQI